MNPSSLPTRDAGSAAPGADAAIVRAEVDAILADPLFAHSRRCQAFLRYVVERTLDGHGAELKERTVGVEALGRPLSYDTGQDPVVRTTAAEVRKRLAQYYQQHPPSTLRLVLPTGSYVPAVEWLTVTADRETPVAAPRRRSDARRYALAGIMAMLCVVTVTYLVRASSRPSAVDDFWKPVLSANGTVKVFVGPATQSRTVLTDTVTIDAASTLSRIAGLLQQRGTSFQILQERQGAFADLRADPVVTIGLFNNQWTRQVNQALRFQLEAANAVPRLSILDSAHSSAHRWTRRFAVAGEPDSVVEDFALISRVLDARFGQWVIALGGIGPHGTSAAGEFVTSARHLQRFVEGAPANWAELNVQIVIATSVQDRMAGPPRVVTSHFWR